MTQISRINISFYGDSPEPRIHVRVESEAIQLQPHLWQGGRVLDVEATGAGVEAGLALARRAAKTLERGEGFDE